MKTALGPAFLAGSAVYLPHNVDLASNAVSRGVVSQATVQNSGIFQLPVEESLSPPDMAIEAAVGALAQAEVSGSNLDAIFFASTHFQGASFWSPAHYIAAGLGARKATPIGIMTMCNGAGTALDLAQRFLATSDHDAAVLVCTADRYPDEVFDRWDGDYGVSYGDGATAAVLSNTAPTGSTRGRRLLASEAYSIPELESLHRPQGRLLTSRLQEPARHLVKPHKKAYLQAHGRDALSTGFGKGLHELVPRLLASVGCEPNDPRVRRVFVPRVGADTIDASYRPALEGTFGLDVCHLQSLTGHLGAGDTIANLNDEESVGEPGEITLFLSAGAGFTLTLAAVETLR